MSGNTDYSSRSRAVRSAAQGYLRELRARRAAQRRGPASTTDANAEAAVAPALDSVAVDSAAVSSTSPLRSSDRAHALAQAAAEEQADAPLAADEELHEADTPDVASQDDAADIAAEAVDSELELSAMLGSAAEIEAEQTSAADLDGEAENAPTDAGAADAGSAEQGSDADTSDETVAVDADDRATNAPEGSDLALLPNIKPGLVWALSAAGASSLKELADADADALRAKLGVIGELVNVDEWVSIARSHVERENGSS